MKIEKVCQCGKTYLVREIDLKRGWGKSCSKSCAAIKRTIRENRGDFRIAKASEKYQNRFVNFDDDQSWEAHKNC